MSQSASPVPSPHSASPGPVNRHAPTAVERQRAQLEKLLKDPAKPAYVPPPPKEKTIRPAREMMKNVQGSSAGAGSGEFHVYKASRRREYERLKLMDEASQKEADAIAFEMKKREWEEQAAAKTAKNRAKRQKKKERVKGKDKSEERDAGPGRAEGAKSDAPLKKRRLLNGQELVFKRPGGESEDESGDDADIGPAPSDSHGPTDGAAEVQDHSSIPVVNAQRIIIHEED